MPSVVLIAIGLGVLAAFMWMSGRFGWSLQENDGDRIASAVIYGLADPAAGMLSSVSGFMLRQRRWLAGPLAGLCSMVLVCYSVVIVYSFMSPRIARLEAHDRVVEAQQQKLNWQRNVSIKREVPHSERLYLRTETRQSEERLERLLAIIPDAAAQSLAEILGITPRKAQRYLVMAAACAGQFINLTCLFFGSLNWPHRVRRTSAVESPPSGGGDSKPVQDTSTNAPPASDTPPPPRGRSKPVQRTTANSSASDLPAVNSSPVTSPSPTSQFVGSDSRIDVTGMRPPRKRIPLSKAKRDELAEAADLFIQGESPWQSIRALARALGCHHSTAGDYVQRAEQRKTSQQCTRPPKFWRRWTGI